MNTILTPKSGFVSFVVASATSSIVPVIALSQNAVQIRGKNFRRGASGNAGTKPRIERSMARIRPTRMPMPYVCTSRMPGNDQSDPDSRTQTEKPDVSSARRNSTSYFPGSSGGSILQVDGFHFEPSFSSLKCVLVMNGICRYFESSTTVLTSRMTSPFGSGPTLSKYSVIVALALYGTPFFLR